MLDMHEQAAAAAPAHRSAADEPWDLAQQLASAEMVWLWEGSDPELAPEIVHRVLESRSPEQLRGLVKRLPAHGHDTWWLGLPIERRDRAGQVLVLIRRGSRFSPIEVGRVQALLRMHAAASPVDGSRDITLDDGGAVTVRDVTRADLQALVRLHRRCGATSLHRRYLGALPSDPTRMLGEFVDVDNRSCFGVGAAMGTEVVGFAQAVATRSGDMELAVLIEDGHQRRGIGTVLVRELRERLRASGVDSVLAIAFPDNVGIRRVLGNAGQCTTGWDDGMLHITTRFAQPLGTAAVPSSAPAA